VKALNVMMFLLIFNVSISLVGALSIYHLGIGVENQYDVSQIDPEAGMYMFIGDAMAIMITFAIGGAILGAIARRPLSESAAYSFYAGLITTVFVTSYRVLGNIINVVPIEAQFGVTIVVGLFLGITGIMFALGFMQLIRGGVESYM